MARKRVGCGYNALGLAFGRKGEQVRDLHTHDQVGLWTSELRDLARKMGGRLVGLHTERKLVRAYNPSTFRVERAPRGPTVSQWTAAQRREHRQARMRGRYVLAVPGHFVGVFIGADGSISYSGAHRGWMMRARILHAYRVETPEEKQS